MNKSILAIAIISTLAATEVAQAVNVLSMSIEDWDGDNIPGGFAFAPGVSDTSKYTHFFDSTSSVSSRYSTCTTGGGGIIPTGEQSSSTPGTDDSFTAGFAFNSYGFTPNSLNAAGSGMNTNPGSGIVTNAVNNGDSTLGFSAFTWSGSFGTQMFPLSPDNGFTTNVLTQGGLCPAALGSNQACYILRWESFIPLQAGFEGDTVWQIEGIATLDGNASLGLLDVILNLDVNGGGIQECAEIGGTSVTVIPTVNLGGGAIFDSISYIVNGNSQPSNEDNSLTILLPLGGHNIEATVLTTTGESATDSISVEVRDTQPPTAIAAFLDKHGNEIATSEQGIVAIDLRAEDVCDAAPVITGSVKPVMDVNDGDTFRVRRNLGKAVLPTSAVELSATAEDAHGNTSSIFKRLIIE